MTLRDDPPERPRAVSAYGLSIFALACVIFVAVFAFYARSVVHRWYTAPILMDFGWFNYLIGGRSLSLQDPSGMDDQSYYSIHVAPMLVAFSGVSRLLHLQGVQPMATMLGCAFGGAAAMAFLILERFLRPAGSIAALSLGTIGAFAYAVSGTMRSTVDYPHMEILYVPLALLVLHLLFQGRRLWVWPALAACLAVREDVGLHLACILGAYLALAALAERAVPRRLSAIAPVLGVGLAYSIMAILWQRTNWPNASTFSQIYSGASPYQHLTPALITHRLSLFAGPSLWAALTVLATLSVWPFHRRWTALTGLLASLPWLTLNLTAKSAAAGELMGYYAFPILVTVLVPLIVAGAAEPAPQEDRLDILTAV